MQEKDFLTILDKVAQGILPPKKALDLIGILPFENMLNGLQLDHHRHIRTGLGEVVFAQGKSLQHLLEAVTRLAAPNNEQSAQKVLVTRVTPEQGKALKEHFPQGDYCEQAKLFALNASLKITPPWPAEGELIIVTAGASDLPVALEALGTANFFGLKTGIISDVGVAGLHRLTPYLESLRHCKLIIAVAGMEGALPSVLAGLLPCPVLGVPVSTGYGVGAGGFSALMGMLSSCAPGLSVFNIDNGFGAAAFAAKLIRNFSAMSNS